MMPLDQLLTELCDGLIRHAQEQYEDSGMVIESMELNLPSEWKSGDEGEICASLPRGRLATGFDPYVNQMQIKYVRK